jgi:lipoprotein-anchoring transpeptidase ErfK/SrfK
MASLAAAVAAVAHVGTPRAPHPAGLVARPLHASVVLRTDPGGRALVRVGPRTIFGGRVAFGVVAERGNWLKVTSEALPNGRFGWVRRGSDVSVRTDAWALHASLSRHTLFVLRRGKVVRRIPVAIGAPGSPTPTGRYAVSEKLAGSRFGSVYGCCILGLTAHQPHPPAGWSTGVAYYVAIHGGSGIGANVSAGCLHASDRNLRFLMRWIPLGTAIRISR